MDAWDEINAFMLRIVAFALDAVVDHPDVNITEEQYEELLLEASRRMRAELGEYPPAYPEALGRVATAHVEAHRARFGKNL